MPIKTTVYLDNDVHAAMKQVWERRGDDSWNINQGLRGLAIIKKALGGEVKAKSVKRFVKPSNYDLYEYMTEKGLSITRATTQAQTFLDHYDSNGWMVGKNSMKDWKATVRKSWLKEGNGNGQQQLSAVDRVRAACGRDAGSVDRSNGVLRDGLHDQVRGKSQQQLGIDIEGDFSREDTPGRE